MSESGEPFDVSERIPPDENELPAPEPARKRPVFWIAGGAAVVLLAGVAGYVLWPRPAPRPVEESVSAPAPAPLVEAAPEPALPALDDSDVLLRNLLRGLISRPAALEWLLTDEIARRIAIAVDNVADGVSPRRALRLLAPSGDFRARTTDAGLEAHPSSFARYDGIAAGIAEADMTAAAQALDQVMPILEDAYAELGRTDRGFAQALLLALERLLAAPVPDTPVLLRELTFRYEYQQDTIEALDPASKHLVRFGPANQRRIQAALAPLAAHLRSAR